MEYPFKDLLPLDEVLAREGYYKDWTHLDPEVFYSLTQISNFIKTKGYGVDVRLLIAQLAEHFGLKTTQVVDLGNLIQAEHATLKQQVQQAVAQVNADRDALETQFNQSVAQFEADKNTIVANATVDSEVILARGGKPNLKARLDETTAQLDQKANYSEVYLKQKGININDLDEPTRQAFLEAQGVDVNYILGEGNVKNENIAMNTITTDRIRHTNSSSNLFKSEIEQGVLNRSSGLPVESDSFLRTIDFIPVKPNTVYTISDDKDYRYRIYEYDSEFTYVGSKETKTFTTSSTTVYVKASTFLDVNHSDLNVKIILNEGTVPLSYETPLNKIPFSLLEDEEKMGIIAQAELSLNLLKSDLELGSIIRYTGLTSEANKEDYLRSKSYFKVKPDTTYTISDDKGYAYRIFEYDNALNYTLTDAKQTHTITTGDRTRYLKIATYNTNHNTLSVNIMINEGELALPYEPYGYRIPERLIAKEGVNSTTELKYKGKHFMTFGDSITWYDGKPYNPSNKEEGTIAKGYQTHMIEQLGVRVTNKGASGQDVTQIYNIINSADYSGVDVVTITSGANDHRKGVPFGTVLPPGSDFDTTTYAGAIQASIEKVINENHDIKIFLMTPIKGWYHEYNTVNVPNESPDAVGVLWEEYPNIMKQIGELYGIPVCDWYGKSGINEINRPTMIGDKEQIPYYLHPSTKGYERMADVLIPFLINH